jgi:predicted permease
MPSNLRYTWRVLNKARSFSLLAIFVLALGIGGVATQFSIINGMILRLPAFPHAERLMSVSLVNTTRGQPVGGAGTADYLDWRASQQSFEEIALYAPRFSINVTFQNTPRRYSGVYVTHSFFRTLGVTPMLGRDFSEDDDRRGAARTIIIGHQIWQNDFGGIADIIGQSVRVNGQPGTVIGVMPVGFSFPSNEQLWAPVFNEFPPAPRGNPQGFGGPVLARLKPGVTMGQAEAELSTSARQIARDFPESNKNLTAVQVEPFAQAFFGPQMRQILYVMLGAVVAVLLIACVNVMNMQFARAAGRMRDLAVCSALGASRWQLVRQLLIESFVLSACGALGGTLLALWASDALLQQTRALRNPPPSWVTFDLDGRVLAVTILATVGTAILSGLIPAWLATRSQPLEALREGGRGGTNRRVNLIIRGLVVLQIALTTSLLIVSTFMIRSIINQQRINWGYDTHAVLTARMSLFQADHPTPQALGQFCDRVLQTLRSDPNFSDAALSTRFRLAISNNGTYEVDGTSYPDNLSRPNAAIENISDGYFNALGLHMLAGRDFTPADGLDQQPVAIVNTAFARRHFGNESPLGRRVRLPQGNNIFGPWLMIVGVAPDTRMQGPYDGQSDGAGIFTPLAQAPQRFLTIIVRGPGGDPARLGEPLRKAMTGIAKDQPIYMVNTADRLIDETLAQNRLLAAMFSVFGGVAMLLAAVGLYGVMSFGVSQRTNEYGIRMALGADSNLIRQMILRQGAVQLTIGLGLGLALAIGLVVIGRAFMQSSLYQVSQTDPWVWGAPVLLLSVVTLLACLVPARRATRINPIEALRAE